MGYIDHNKINSKYFVHFLDLRQNQGIGHGYYKIMYENILGLNNADI
ncbi:MAG: hypothetical protein PUD25_05975 [Bacilli bacterium]|nr:hypothetical protein [Bacilli bacterium]